MNKSTARFAAAGALTLLVGHLSGCTDGFLAAIDQDATGPGAVADVDETRQRLATLTIAPEGSGTGYSREAFPHWSTVSGACDTRETVLKEQGADVRVDSRCRPTSGTWASPYDGATWTRASDVDIDHLVPLAEAWRSGASAWSEQTREVFANDLGPRGDGRPQLVAVTDNLNQSKGDRDPARWLPPAAADRCRYAVDWIQVKTVYGLTADRAEVAALRGVLDGCGGTP